MTYTARVIFKTGIEVDVRDRLDPIARLSCSPGVRRATWVKLDAPRINQYMRSMEGVIFKAGGLLNERELREARRR